MAMCNLCGEKLVDRVHYCLLCEEARLVGLVECLRSEIEYLRLRCSEECVCVAASKSLPWNPGLVSAYAIRKVPVVE